MKRPLLRRSEAARYLVRTLGIPCTIGALNKLAVSGGGPPFSKFGRFPLYDPDDLDCWAEAKLVGPFISTSAFSQQKQ